MVRSSRVARMETRLYTGGSRARLPSRNRINAPVYRGIFYFLLFFSIPFLSLFFSATSTSREPTRRRNGGKEGRRYRRRRVSSTGQPLWDSQNLIRPYEKKPSTGPISRHRPPATELPGLTNILQRKLRKLLEERDQTVIASIFPRPRTTGRFSSHIGLRGMERQRESEREERSEREPQLMDLLTG